MESNSIQDLQNELRQFAEDRHIAKSDMTEEQQALYDACLCYGPEEFGPKGESFDLEEDML